MMKIQAHLMFPIRVKLQILVKIMPLVHLVMIIHLFVSVLRSIQVSKENCIISYSLFNINIGKYCDALLTTTTLTTLNNDHNNILLTFHGITTTATTKQKTLCDPNPCKNRGACSINSNLNTYTCFCTPQFKG